MSFFDDLKNIANQLNGSISGGTSAFLGADPNQVRFKTTSPDAASWNKLQKYWFEMVETKQGKIVPVKSIQTGSGVTIYKNSVDLDLPPTSIQVSTQFSISTAASNQGIIEEHNGVVFRTVVLSGTTGIMPLRGTKFSGPPKGTLGVATRIFPGTAAAVAGISNGIAAGGAFVGGKFGQSKDGVDALSDQELTHTGYYRFWTLYNMLVSYAEVKKLPGNEKLRLMFASKKDNIGYICTPMSFDLKKDASDPMAYRYQIVLKCFLVVDLKDFGGEGNFFGGLDIRNESYVKSALEAVRRLRKSVQSFESFFKGFQSDVGDVYNLASQVELVYKDVLGVGYTAANFIDVIINNRNAIFKNNDSLIQDALDKFKDQPTQEPYPVIGTVDLYDPTGTQPAPSVASPATNGVNGTNGATGPTGETGAAGPAGAAGADGSALNFNKAMSAFLKSTGAQELVDMVDLSLTPTIKAQIQTQIDAARAISTGQIFALTAKLQELSDNLAKLQGAMSTIYATVYGVPASAVGADNTINEEAIILANQIQEAKDSMLVVLASMNAFQHLPPDPFKTANQNLADDDQISSPSSAIPVAVDRDSSLEAIAYRYLGDANRAKEIALLNNLRAPYIDETGFQIPISLASGRTFIVNSRTNLVLDQSILIQGTGVAQTRRRIVNIEDIGGGQFRVTVDGNDDLSRFDASTSPFATIRLPGTIGSGDFILIPSLDRPDDLSAPTPPTSIQTRLSHAEKVFKIDLAEADNGDFILDPSGDFKMSYGYDNAAQALRIKVETERGELEQHPSFGIPAAVGQPNSSVPPDQVVSLIKSEIKSDPRFTDATVQVQAIGSEVRLQIEAKGHGGTGRIPIEFDITPKI